MPKICEGILYLMDFHVQKNCSEVKDFHFVQRSKSFEEKHQKSFQAKITNFLSYFIFIKKPCCYFIELLEYIFIYSKSLGI